MVTEKILTIIIPTYNMEQYIARCLDSLLIKDNFEKLDILVIIDGGKDRSSEIAHTYQDKYPQVIRVIDKENGNYGSCINIGLQEAKGKYVRVLDSDDYFNINSFQQYINELIGIDSDMIINPFSIIKNDKIIETNDLLFKKYIEEFTLMSDRELPSQMHCITYRKDILSKMKYRQTEGISYTDTEWCFYPLALVKSVTMLKINVYQYILGRDGQTVEKSIFVNRIYQLQEIVIKMLKYLTSEINLEKKVRYRMEDYLFSKLELIYPIGAYSNNKRDLSLLKEIDSLALNYNDNFYSRVKSISLVNKLPIIKAKHWSTNSIIFRLSYLLIPYLRIIKK